MSWSPVPRSPVHQDPDVGDWGMGDRRHEAAAFLRALVFAADTAATIELRVLGASVDRGWFTADEQSRLIDRAIDAAERGGDVYVGVQPRRRGGGGAADVTSIGAVFADLDCGAGKKIVDKDAAARRLSGLASGSLPPSMVVDSGGGLHAYWLLRERWLPSTWPSVRRVLLGLAHALDADPAVCDLARILRLPGTFNWKTGAARRVRLLRCWPHRRYDLTDFAAIAVDPSPGAPRHQQVVSSNSAVIPECLRATGWAFRVVLDPSGTVEAYVIEQPCPACPGPPGQHTPPRAGTAHISPSGVLRCKRGKCFAGPVAAPDGLLIEKWTAQFAPHVRNFGRGRMRLPPWDGPSVPRGARGIRGGIRR